MTADAPSLAREILKQTIAFLLDKGVRSGHDPARPIQIAKGKRRLETPLARVTKHRSKRTVNNVSFRFQSDSLLCLKTYPQILQMFQ